MHCAGFRLIEVVLLDSSRTESLQLSEKFCQTQHEIKVNQNED